MIFWIQVYETVVAYARFTAVDNAAALGKAEKLWNDGKIILDRGVADVCDVRLEVVSEDGADSRLMVADAPSIEIETAFERLSKEDGEASYCARYVVTRSLSTSKEAEDGTCSIDQIFTKACEDYRAGKLDFAPCDLICFAPKVEVFQAVERTAAEFVDEINLSEVC